MSTHEEHITKTEEYNIKDWTGNELRDLRKTLQLSQIKFGELLEMDPKTIRTYEQKGNKVVKLKDKQKDMLKYVQYKLDKTPRNKINGFIKDLAKALAIGTAAVWALFFDVPVPDWIKKIEGWR